MDPYIIAVSIDLGPPDLWNRIPPDAGDPPDWAVIQINKGLISIVDINNNTTYEAQKNTMVYTFKPMPDASSPRDTTWRIVRWTEIRTQ
jgi:hypothetical protein